MGLSVFENVFRLTVLLEHFLYVSRYMSVISERLKTASKSSENVVDVKYYEQGDQNCPHGAVKRKMRAMFAWESHVILSSFYKISFRDATAPSGARYPHYRGF